MSSGKINERYVIAGIAKQFVFYKIEIASPTYARLAMTAYIC